jgi:DNA-binding NtrC family response regulator
MVMPRSDGIDLVGRIRARSDVPIIVFTAYGTVATAVSALKSGADEFVSSSELQLDQIVGLVRRALLLGNQPGASPELEERLVGRTRAMATLRGRLAGLIPLATPVLVSGERGTGRDTVARAIHDLGRLSNDHFVRFDARSFFPEPEKAPRSGTVYIDGVEHLSQKAQSYWIKEIRHAEATRYAAGARILASTSDDLSVRASEGAFDPHLARILMRFRIELPPLRDRLEDLPSIAEALVGRIGQSLGRTRIALSAEAIEFLKTQRWPGNVAQLRELLEKAIAFSRSRIIRRGTLEEVLGDLEESLATIRKRHSTRERDELFKTMRQTGGNISKTAEILGKSRSAVYRLIEKHGIRLTRRR